MSELVNSSDEANSIPHVEEEDQKSKRKRRSKNDQYNRNFTCGCGKKYLSYPALYTHIKTKHRGSNPDGTLAPSSFNIRGRGRPKKDSSIQEIAEGTKAISNKEIKENALLDSVSMFDDEQYFQKINIKCGPCKLADAFDFLVKSNSNHPQIYEQIYLYTKEVEGKTIDSLCNCNLILGEFLRYMQNLVCLEFMKSVIILIRYMRDCLNSCGWELLTKKGPLSDNSEEYCSKLNAECLPDICNKFITEYLPTHCPKYDKNLAIKIILFMCNWLHKNHYTSSRLTIL